MTPTNVLSLFYQLVSLFCIFFICKYINSGLFVYSEEKIILIAEGICNDTCIKIVFYKVCKAYLPFFSSGSPEWAPCAAKDDHELPIFRTHLPSTGLACTLLNFFYVLLGVKPGAL